MGIEKAFFSPGENGKLIIGNDVINLKDETKKTFETDNMEAFERFLLGRDGKEEIYYSADHLYLVPVEVSKNSRALAHCSLKPSPPLALLVSKICKDLSIVEFEKLLTALRKYAQGGHMGVLSNLRSFSVAKKQTYQRDVDNGGNYKLVIQRESAGANDWVPPAILTFAVPVFTYLEELVTLESDLIFSMSSEDQPVFRLENLNFVEEIQERRQEVIESRLGKAATCPKYWGNSQVHVLDDSWSFRENVAKL